jgi:DNA-directed RNA polymerase subunit RPC12/RpoP
MLRCVECGKEATDSAIEWRGYLTDDDEVAIYCPDCAEREFGAEPRRWPPGTTST